MIKIHTAKITSRVTYTFDLIFSRILKIPHEVTTSKADFETYKGPKLIYGLECFLTNTPFIQAHELLFQTGIQEVRPKVKVLEDKNQYIFFENTSLNSLLPFDLFACAFYMTSRYEEYLPHVEDIHKRFEAMSSLAKKGNFLKDPIVNQHAYWLKKELKKCYPNIGFPKQTHNVKTTLDIDNAYAYKYKGVRRNVASLSKKAVKFNIKDFNKQIAVLGRLKKDPYDSYDKQQLLHKKYNITPTYFFLLGDYAQYDKNISHRKKGIKKLIKTLHNNNSNIGIHPSYRSYLKPHRIKKEKKRLEKILDTKVTHSRQHYLKFKIPDTYQQLEKIGITDDYSMGFASKIGFRAGICTPFPFYDLQEEKTTSLIIHPFCLMDTTLKQYLKIRSKNVIKYITPMFNKIKEVNGDIHILFHNESIEGDNEWKNWHNVYEDVLKLALEKND